MAPPEGTIAGRLALVDAVDHLLNRGAVLVGDATLSVAGIDLVYVGLNLLVASVETLRQGGASVGPGGLQPTPPRPTAPSGSGRDDAGQSPFPSDPLNPIAGAAYSDSDGQAPVARAPAFQFAGLPGQTEGSPGEPPERGIARLVLTLVELLRRIVERQAVRRMEGNSLAEVEVERMGRALMELEQTMIKLRAVFGLEEADLTIDLGPLGRLV